MKLLTIAATAALLTLGTAAQAQQMNSPTSPLYGELGYTFLSAKGNGVDANPGAIRGIIGYDVHPLVSVEGMLAFSAKKDNFNDGTENIDLKLQHAYGVFVKPKFSPTNNIEVFGRLGWVHSKIEGCGSISGCGSATDSGAAYGAGVNYRFNPKMHVGLDYVRYSKNDGVRVDGVTLAFGYRF